MNIAWCLQLLILIKFNREKSGFSFQCGNPAHCVEVDRLENMMMCVPIGKVPLPERVFLDAPSRVVVVLFY